MLILLGTTITASFFRQPQPIRHCPADVAFSHGETQAPYPVFILGIGAAHSALGMAVYIRITAWASQLLDAVMTASSHCISMGRNWLPAPSFLRPGSG